jgi:Xaa-Pro dipeptidase
MTMQTQSSPWRAQWSNAVFSLEERDRRWAKVRGLMARDAIDAIICLPCTNCHDRGTADSRYLTQLGENSDEVTVAFPIEGPVTAWHSWAGIWPGANWFEQEIRAVPARGAGGLTITGWLNENPRFQTATIGVAGLDSSLIARIRESEGEVNWRSLELLKQSFPKARFVSATPLLGEARWQKSQEEIEFIGRGVQIAEVTLAALREHAHAGVAERRLFAEMMYANAKAGGSFTPMVGWISGPLDAPYHRLEQPTFRTLEPGDVIGVEVEGRWGGYIAQIDQTLFVGQPPAALGEGTKLACEAFDRVLDKIAPGVRMGELIEAATLSGLAGRLQSGLGMHGRGTGDDGPLLVSRRPAPPAVLAMELKEGCCFALKPSALLDGKLEYGRWGDSVVVTARGARRLGTRPQELFVQSWGS